MNKENKKILGPSSYKNSKDKKSKKITKENDRSTKEEKLKKATIQKNRQLKVKIKHLQKEIKRIESGTKLADQKMINEKAALEKKLKKLLLIKEKFINARSDGKQFVRKDE